MYSLHLITQKRSKLVRVAIARSFTNFIVVQSQNDKRKSSKSAITKIGLGIFL